MFLFLMFLGLTKSCLSEVVCPFAECRNGKMDYSMRRDQNNPHWNYLFRHVKELNDKLLSIANFYLCEDVTSSVRDKKILPKATSNISDACLEVTDATCVVVATMRSIIRKQIMDTKIDGANIAPSHENITEKHDKKKEIDESGQAYHELVGNDTVPITSKQINEILSFVEIALVLSQANKKQAVEDILTHAAAIIEKILETDRRSIRRQPTNIVSKRLKTENR